MPTLYNLKTVPHSDKYRMTKFTADLVPEGSYLLDAFYCECPAGPRPTCRHRMMLPRFLDRKAENTGWFYDYDRGGWVQMQDDPEPVEAMIASDIDTFVNGTGTDEPSLPAPAPIEPAPIASWRRF